MSCTEPDHPTPFFCRECGDRSCCCECTRDIKDIVIAAVAVVAAMTDRERKIAVNSGVLDRGFAK